MKKPLYFTLILIFIFIILAYNIISTKIKLDNYHELTYKIQKVTLTNKDFDTYINSTFSYSNFDEIEKLIKEIEENLKSLIEESNITLADKEIKNQLLNVENSIEDKIIILKKIESYRAILNNSFRLIQKIHDKIHNEKLTKIYTLIMTIDKNRELDLKSKLQKINNIKANNTYEEYFLKHVNTIINYYNKYSELKKLSNDLQTHIEIDKYKFIYEEYVNNIIQKAQTSIIITFLILFLLIAINLLSSYKIVAINQNLSRFKRAVQNSDNIIMVTDVNQKIKYVNEAFLNTTGYAKDEVIGKTPAILKSGKKSKEFYKELNEVISKGKTWNGEFINYNKFGDLRYEKASIIPIFNSKNEIIEYMAIKLDITDDILKNKEIKEKDSMLAQQSKMAAMGEMLENIAHQWRQPLSAISSNATGLILQKSIGIDIKDEDVLKTLNSINDSSQYLSETINSFRDFFKTDKNTKVFNIKESCSKALSFVESKIKDYNVTVIENLKDTNINGMESEFIQVIMNFYSNSIDILIEKDISQRYILISSYEKDGYSFLEVKDSGDGIPDNIMNRVFEPYFTTKHQSRGTGIGLYMSREIIVKHLNGDIYVKNDEYEIDGKKLKGAVFTIKIPTSS